MRRARKTRIDAGRYGKAALTGFCKARMEKKGLSALGKFLRTAKSNRNETDAVFTVKKASAQRRSPF